MRTARRALVASLLVLFLAATPAPAEPPTDAQIDQLITDVNAAAEAVKDPSEAAAARRELLLSRMSGIAWDQVTAAQLDRLAAKGLLRPYPEVRQAVLPRLKELSAEPTLEGARCADILMACWMPPRSNDPDTVAADLRARGDALLAALAHPRMADLFRAGKGGNLFAAVPQFPVEVVRERGFISAIEPFITTDLMPMTAGSLGGIYDLISSESFDAPPETLDRLRRKIAAAALAAADRDDPRLADDPRQAASIRRNLRTLAATCNGAFARGELLDHPAPPITFTWSSTEPPIRSWEDLKGRVVVADFWATWCGPCVAAFPKMRALAEHYRGSPVVILGVTSDQGFHIARSKDPDSRVERIDCADDPAKEHALMSGYIRDMDVTWPVVFSEENVFNPDFGVRGIPHLAVIDPAGRVRHNGLRPGDPADLAAKIDALLAEFNLPRPPAPLRPK